MWLLIELGSVQVEDVVLLLQDGGFVAPFEQGGKVVQAGGFDAPFPHRLKVLQLGGFVAPLIQVEMQAPLTKLSLGPQLGPDTFEREAPS